MNKVEREKEILIRYSIQGQTLEEIGNHFDISRERVRQILEYLGISNRKQNNLRVRMRRLYDFLIEYKRIHYGNSPNVVEMRDGAKLSTKGRVYGTLRALEQVGLIEFQQAVSGYKKRTQIKILGSEWIPPKDVDVITALNRVLLRKNMKKKGK